MDYNLGPLFLPDGSVRALVILSILMPLPFFLLKGQIGEEFYKSISLIVIGYLFGQISQLTNKNAKPSQELEQIQGDLAKMQKDNMAQKSQIKELQQYVPDNR
jgi:uncharacterized membrane protein YqaE (UPF0057 family)